MAEANSPQDVERPVHHTLPRILGPFDAMTIVVGGIIGSGIFFKATTLAKLGLDFGPIMAVWVLIGLHTLCGSLTLGELAAALPHAGGPYVYLREAYGRLVAFLWGWSEFWIIRTASLGALASATVIYLSKFVELNTGSGLSRMTQATIAVLIILGLSIINILGTRWAANVQNVTTVIKVGFLGAIVVLPWLMNKGSTQNFSPAFPESVSVDFWRAIGAAMIAVLWPYDGWINIAPVAEEIREPQRNVPFALTLGTLTIMLIYLGANISYHLVLPMSDIAQSNGVAADVFRVLFGPIGGQIAALGVMCSTFGATNSNLITGPRIYFAMARDGLLPQAVRHIHGSFQTPSNAVILQATWSVALTMAAFAWKEDPGDAFDALTDFVIFGALLFYALVVAAVPILRRKRPDLERPYRTWGYPVTPWLYLLGSSGVMVSMLLEKREQTAAGTLLILAGCVYYFWATRRKSAA